MNEDYFVAGPADALQPGAMRCYVVNGRRLLVANIEGQYFAADELCPHEDASLCKGNLQGWLVRCPLHGSRFNLRTGQVMEEPAESDLRTYPVKIENGSICIRTA
jgi:3-phenylpropionate/trans-cinnamate dioxygenase ferredoxin component